LHSTSSFQAAPLYSGAALMFENCIGFFRGSLYSAVARCSKGSVLMYRDAAPLPRKRPDECVRPVAAFLAHGARVTRGAASA